MIASLAVAAACGEDPSTSMESMDSDDAACVDQADDPPWRSLIDHRQWQPDTDGEDPMADHRPAAIECNGGWYPELGGIEIDTGACNYLSVRQALGTDVTEGDPIRLQMWWATLASVEPGQGHIALLIDDELLWEHHVEIPGDAEALTVDFDSPMSAPEGASLTLHLHNHGYNTWNFHTLTTRALQCE